MASCKPVLNKGHRKSLLVFRIYTIVRRFGSDVQPSALFIEVEDATTSAAKAALAESTSGRMNSGGDERARSTTVGGFWFGLDTRHAEDAPGVAVIKRQPGGLEPSNRRSLGGQLQVWCGHGIPLSAPRQGS